MVFPFCGGYCLLLSVLLDSMEISDTSFRLLRLLVPVWIHIDAS